MNIPPNNDNYMTKTCSICGINKPLTEFIIDSVNHIKQYCDICRSCRSKTDKTGKQQTDEDGGKTRQTKIDFNARLFDAHKQKEAIGKFEYEKEQYRKEINDINKDKKENLDLLEEELLKTKNLLQEKEKNFENWLYSSRRKRDDRSKQTSSSTKKKDLTASFRTSRPIKKQTSSAQQSQLFNKTTISKTSRTEIHSSLKQTQKIITKASQPRQPTETTSSTSNMNLFNHSRADITEIKNRDATLIATTSGAAIFESTRRILITKQSTTPQDTDNQSNERLEPIKNNFDPGSS